MAGFCRLWTFDAGHGRTVHALTQGRRISFGVSSHIWLCSNAGSVVCERANVWSNGADRFVSDDPRGGLYIERI